jgi:GNAT superfamily N-acetyltransferase
MSNDGTVRVRHAAADEAALLSGLILKAFSAYPVPLVPPSSAPRETPEVVRAKLVTDHGAGIAEIGATPVGCVLFTREADDRLYLGRLAVLPPWRGRGVARALLAFVETEARRLGARTISLSVRIALPDNQRLFASCGFIEVSRDAHPGFTEPTSINMEKRLG